MSKRYPTAAEGCPECGGRLEGVDMAVTNSNPPQRVYRCVDCGWRGRRYTTDKRRGREAKKENYRVKVDEGGLAIEADWPLRLTTERGVNELIMELAYLREEVWPEETLETFPRLVRWVVSGIHNGVIHPLLFFLGSPRWVWLLHDMTGHIAFPDVAQVCSTRPCSLPVGHDGIMHWSRGTGFFTLQDGKPVAVASQPSNGSRVVLSTSGQCAGCPRANGRRPKRRGLLGRLMHHLAEAERMPSR